MKNINQLNNGPYNYGFQWIKSPSIELFCHCTHFTCIYCLCQPTPLLPPLWPLPMCHFFILLLHIHILPPLLLCTPSSPYMDRQTPLLSPSPFLLYLLSCPMSDFFSIATYLFTSTNILLHEIVLNTHTWCRPWTCSPKPPHCPHRLSPPSSSPPSLTSSIINSLSPPCCTSPTNTSWSLSTSSCTHDNLKTDMNFQERKPTSNQFYVRPSDILSLFQKIHIIKGRFPVISRKSSFNLTWFSIYCLHRYICYHICRIKGWYKKSDKWHNRGPWISWGVNQGIKLQGRRKNPSLLIMGCLTSRIRIIGLNKEGGHCIHDSVNWSEGQEQRFCSSNSGTNCCSGTGTEGYLWIPNFNYFGHWGHW